MIVEYRYPDHSPFRARVIKGREVLVLNSGRSAFFFTGQYVTLSPDQFDYCMKVQDFNDYYYASR